MGKEHRREFLENRIRAEKKAREKSCEITLDQIYQELVDTYKSDIVELLQKTEVQIELENCHKKETIFPFYEQCIQKGKESSAYFRYVSSGNRDCINVTKVRDQ